MTIDMIKCLTCEDMIHDISSMCEPCTLLFDIDLAVVDFLESIHRLNALKNIPKSKTTYLKNAIFIGEHELLNLKDRLK